MTQSIAAVDATSAPLVLDRADEIGRLERLRLRRLAEAGVMEIGLGHAVRDRAGPSATEAGPLPTRPEPDDRGLLHRVDPEKALTDDARRAASRSGLCFVPTEDHRDHETERWRTFQRLHDGLRTLVPAPARG